MIVAAAWAAWPDAPTTADWEVLQTSPVEVACARVDGLPWCRATLTLAAPLERLLPVVDDFDAYPRIFPRIQRVQAVDEATKYGLLDFPSPLADRDYLARFVREDRDGYRRIAWHAVVHDAFPARDGVVRLPLAAGQWELRSEGTGTWTRYMWVGDLGGALADWIVARTWTTTGTEVIGGLAGAVGLTL